MLSFIAFADFFGVSLPTWLMAGYQCDIAELGVGKICAKYAIVQYSSHRDRVDEDNLKS